MGNTFPTIHPQNNHPEDWPEDWKHENGMYQNKCIECGVLFIGYKRRHVCKVCYDSPIKHYEELLV